MQFPKGEKVEILVSRVPFLDSSKVLSVPNCVNCVSCGSLHCWVWTAEQQIPVKQYEKARVQVRSFLCFLTRVQYFPATEEQGWKACWWAWIALACTTELSSPFQASHQRSCYLNFCSLFCPSNYFCSVWVTQLPQSDQQRSGVCVK